MSEVTIEPLAAVTHSHEAEQSVLGGLLMDNDAYDTVGAFLRPEHFYDVAHRHIWAAIATLIAAGKPADFITVSELLTEQGIPRELGWLPYVSALNSASYSTRNIRRHADIIVTRHATRALIAAAAEALEIAQEEGDTAAKVDRITSLFDSLSRKQVKKVPRLIGEIAIERIAEYEDLADGKKIAGWRTHIPWLTSALNGGMRAGGLYILAARPSVGKSSLSQEIGMNFASDELTTLYLSQEMVDTEVADRGVANAGHLSYSALLTGKMGRDDWTRATDAMEKLGRLPFYIDDQASLSLQDIRLKAKSCKGLKVLILDYLQLCTSGRRDGNRNAEIEEISRGLKTLAKELGIAVIALSQLNREVEKRANRKPTLSDLRDSGAIEQDADVVMFLWPVREFPAEGRRIMGLGIEKNRQGRLGEIGLDFFGDVQRWTQSTADISPKTATGERKEL